MTVIPNSLFVSEPVINESYTNDFILHVFTIPLKREDNWRRAQEIFLQVANQHCEPHIEEVRKHMKRLSYERGLSMPSIEPRVTIQVPAAGEIHLVIRIPVKAEERGQIEQSILSEVFTNHDFSTQNENAEHDVAEKKGEKHQ